MSWKELIENEYKAWCNRKTDINEHLPVLRDLASKCDHVTEMGVRFGASSRAFLSTDAALRSYDIFIDENLSKIFDAAKEEGKDVRYIKADVRQIEIEETDLLFIDTWHSYPQLKQELHLHGNKARKYMAFHDTFTYGLRDESWNKNEVQQGTAGLLPAIIRFMIDNPHWKFKEFRTNNNGLTILERG
jgi:hypothetical protein